MENLEKTQGAVRFGPFEYNAASGELWRRGHKVKLAGQPIQLLNLLIERPGTVVTREEIRSRLWAEDTFVDFEHSVNAAIKRLRWALGDSAAKPRFIETVARQGYRFIARVEATETDSAEAPIASLERKTTALPALPKQGSSRMLVTLAILLAVITGWVMVWPFTRLARRSGLVHPDGLRLTLLAAGEGDLSDPAISYDGKMLAYVKGQGVSRRVYLRRVAGGVALRLSHQEAREAEPAFAPDDERIALTRYPAGSSRPQICMAPVLGSELACILDGARSPAWSPDGSRLAFVLEQANGVQALAISKSDGTALRIILTANSDYPFLHHPSWSADGHSIAIERSIAGVGGEVWLVPANGGAASRLDTVRPGVFMHDLVFTPDGKGMVYSSNQAGATNLWYRTLQKHSTVERLTQGPGPEERPSVSRTGRVAFLNVESRDVLFLTHLDTRLTSRLLSHSPYLWAPAISPDGREVAFSQAEYDGVWHIWTVPAAGGEARLLTSGDAPQMDGRFSRDGQWLIYSTSVPGKSRIWRVPRRGGAAQPLTPANEDAAYGDLSPDGRTLVFARTENGAPHLSLIPVAGGVERQLIRSSSTVPRWSPGGDWIAFSPDSGLKGGVFITRPDGGGTRRLTSSGGWPVWLPDGKQLAFRALRPDGNQQIETVTLDGKMASLDGLRFSSDNDLFDFSTDGKVIAYTDGETLSSEIWLLDIDR